MNIVFPAGMSVCLAVCVASCSMGGTGPSAHAGRPTAMSGERLVYIVGCVNCHHQTPKEILNAPPLVVVKGYSLPEFKALMKTGVTRTGRDMYAQGSIMGIVAREQLSHLTEGEITSIHTFLQKDWTAERGMQEEAKIATFPPLTFTKD